MSACPSGAAVPLGSSVLRGLMVFATGSPVSGRACGLPWSSIVRRLSLLLVGLVPDLRTGSPSSGWRGVLRPALVREAVRPSHGLVLRICAGFLFSGPGVCWGFNRLLLMCIPSGCGHPLGQ